MMVDLRKSKRNLFGWFRLLTYANPPPQDVALLVLGCITAIASGLPVPILGIVFGHLMDDLNTASCNRATPDSSARAILRSSINDKVLTVVYIAIGNLFLIYIYIVSWNLFGERLAQRMREKYLQNMLHKDIDFFDRMTPGEMSNHLNADISAIKQGTSQKVGVVINAVSFFVAAYAIAFIKNARLGGILVSLTPAFLFMSLVGGHFIGKYARAMSTAIASASSIALEALSSITVVHAFGANTKLEKKFTEILAIAKAAGIRKAVTASIQGGLLYFIAYSANATAYFLGSRQIANAVEGDGRTTVGEIYTVIFILVDATIILSTVAPFLQLFGAAQSAFAKLEENMVTKPAICDGSAANILERLDPSIELRNVSFAYPSRPNVQVLKDISLQMPAGEHTAIVGLSGSGKSTIASLLLRFYDPSTGTIRLGGIPMRDMPLNYVRGRISFVQQEAALFDRSIFENIALGLVGSQNHQHLSALLQSGKLADIAARAQGGEGLQKIAKDADPHCTEVIELIIQAAVQADADSFIRGLRGGYGTIVGSKGTLLSGGQKQRVVLARALIKNPEILILDEATASLDSVSEQQIQRALNKAGQGRTTITIAHRLSTIKTADSIVVMRAGQVLERGKHEDLIAAGGAYSTLVQLQQNKPESDEDDSSQTAHSASSNSLDAYVDEKETEEPKASGSVSMTKSMSTEPSKEQTAATNEDPDFSIKRSSFFILKAISPMFRPSLSALVIAFIAVLIVGGTYSASAVIFGNTIGALSPCKTASSIRSAGEFFALMFFILAIIEFFANVICWSGFGIVAARVLLKFQVRAFGSLLEQDLQWHESANRTPKSLLSLITTDCNALGGLTGGTVGTIISILVNMVAAIILTHVVAWKIALVCLAVVPLIIGTGAMHLIVLARFATKHAKAFTDSVGVAIEGVEAIKTVAALSLQNEVLETYRRSLRAPVKEMTKQSLYSYTWLALAYGIPTFLFSLSFWWGSTLVLRGEYSQVEYYICTIALLVSAQLWGQLFTIAPDVSQAFAAVQRIINLVNLSTTDSNGKETDLEKHIHTEKVTFHRPTGGAAITFSNVNFSYPARPNIQVLKSLSLTIQPGQFCALVGSSGAGKSTIVALLERMYRPESGTITIDGLDTGSADASFRDSISYVPQDSVLFNGSLRFNLELGAASGQHVSDSDLEEACRLAHIHEKIISLPGGYDYDFNGGSSGTQLSGGEKQRVAIARALIRKPRLLLLDESTSALDAESEKALQDGLEAARKATGMTVVAIAHRLGTIRNADVIFMVDGGRVVDSGSHQELMARCETYRVNAEHQGF